MKTEIPPALVNMTRGIMIAQARLVELDLSDNAFGPVGMEGLVTFLKSPSCFSLQELKLNNTGLLIMLVFWLPQDYFHIFGLTNVIFLQT